MIIRQQTRARGFTLIEMMISAALMAMVLGSAYACLSAGVNSRRSIEGRLDAAQSARTALTMIAADIRVAVPLPGKVEFMGIHRALSGDDADNLDFSTRNYAPKREREPDYCEVSYFLKRDTESGSFVLMRRRDPTPDPEPFEGGVQEEIVRGVKGLRFEYYDYYGKWWDDWGDPDGKTKGMTDPPENSSGLPYAVRITMVVDPETAKGPHPGPLPEGEGKKAPMTFQTIAHLSLAPYFNRQARQSSNPNADSASAPQGDGAQGGAQ